MNSTKHTQNFRWLSKGETEPCLVAFYDIPPGNGDSILSNLSLQGAQVP